MQQALVILLSLLKLMQHTPSHSVNNTCLLSLVNLCHAYAIIHNTHFNVFYDY